MNLTYTLGKELKKVFTQFIVETKGFKNSFTKIVDYKANTCDLIKTAKTNSLFKGLVKNFGKSANFKLECPFKRVCEIITFIQR